jgi:HlyD family secretion protein
MKKHWRAILVAVVLVAVVIGVVSIYQQLRSQQEAHSYQTAVIGRGTLSASIGATGSVEARQQASLAFAIGGRVGEVNTRMGDRVAAGDILAALDPADYPQQVISAQIELINAQRALDDLVTSDSSLAAAELALANAKKALDDARTVYDEAVKNNNQGWVEEAREKVYETYFDWIYYRYHNDGSPKAMAELRKRYQAYIAALQELEKAQEYYDQGIGTGGSKDTQMALDIAKGKLAVAQAQYDDALAEFDRLKDGIPAEDLRAAQARVDAARAILDQVNITAPFSGTILSIELIPGDLVTPGGAVIVIADLSELHVDVPIAEVDYNRLAIGQTASLALDAIPETAYHGQVEQINLNATTLSGSVSYPVKVVITDADKKVLPGMTVAVQIEVAHLEDVLLVPNRAVRTVDGSRVVYISVNGSLKSVEIELGSSNDTMSEVVSGDLKEGDIVVLNPPTTFFNGSGGPMSGGGGGFFGN